MMMVVMMIMIDEARKKNESRIKKRANCPYFLNREHTRVLLARESRILFSPDKMYIFLQYIDPEGRGTQEKGP